MQSLGKKVSKHQRNPNACCHLWQFCRLQPIRWFKSLSVNSIMTRWLSSRDVQQIYLNMICMRELILSLIPKIWLIRNRVGKSYCNWHANWVWSSWLFRMQRTNRLLLPTPFPTLFPVVRLNPLLTSKIFLKVSLSNPCNPFFPSWNLYIFFVWDKGKWSGRQGWGGNQIKITSRNPREDKNVVMHNKRH